MAHRQGVMSNGSPFDVILPKEIPTRDTMTDAEFDSMMEKGLNEAKAGDSIPYEEAKEF